MLAQPFGFVHCLAAALVISCRAVGETTTNETTTEAAPVEDASEIPGRQKALPGDYYNTFHSLHLQILQSYNHHLRPEIGAGRPMTCNFSMVVTHLDKVDEDAQTIDLHGWLVLQWYDHRLAWNDSTEYRDIEKLLMQQKVIWKPDMHLYNNAQSQIESLVSTSTQAQIFSDGRVLIDPTINVRPYCQFNYKHYPWETHKCAVYLGSWAYRTHELQWQLHPITPEATPVVYSNSLRAVPTNWRIVKAITQLSDVHFDSEYWHYVNITFYFKRTPTFAANFILIPAGVTSVLCAMAFLSSAGRGDWKMAILVSTLALEAVHFIAVHAVLPQGVINGGPLIVTLCKANIFLTLIAFILAIISKSLSDRLDETPKWLSKFLRNKLLGQICCFPNEIVEPRYSLKAAQNRRQGQRYPVLETNQLVPPKRSSAQYTTDEIDKAATSSKTDDSQNRPESIGLKQYGGQSYGPWWRLGVMLDRILFVVIAVIYAILWSCYLGF